MIRNFPRKIYTNSDSVSTLNLFLFLAKKRLVKEDKSIAFRGIMPPEVFNNIRFHSIEVRDLMLLLMTSETHGMELKRFSGELEFDFREGSLCVLMGLGHLHVLQREGDSVSHLAVRNKVLIYKKYSYNIRPYYGIVL